MCEGCVCISSGVTGLWAPSTVCKIVSADCGLVWISSGRLQQAREMVDERPVVQLQFGIAHLLTRKTWPSFLTSANLCFCPKPGLIGEGGQYTLPEGEWFCTECYSTYDTQDALLRAPSMDSAAMMAAVAGQGIAVGESPVGVIRVNAVVRRYWIHRRAQLSF
jgi:hypothetical protein